MGGGISSPQVELASITHDPSIALPADDSGNKERRMRLPHFASLVAHGRGGRMERMQFAGQSWGRVLSLMLDAAKGVLSGANHVLFPGGDSISIEPRVLYSHVDGRERPEINVQNKAQWALILMAILEHLQFSPCPFGSASLQSYLQKQGACRKPQLPSLTFSGAVYAFVDHEGHTMQDVVPFNHGVVGPSLEEAIKKIRRKQKEQLRGGSAATIVL